MWRRLWKNIMLWRRYKKCTISVFVDAGFQRFLLWRRHWHHARAIAKQTSHMPTEEEKKMNESRKIIIIGETNDLDSVFFSAVAVKRFVNSAAPSFAHTFPSFEPFFIRIWISFERWILFCCRFQFLFALLSTHRFVSLICGRGRSRALLCHRQIIQLTKWWSLNNANDFRVQNRKENI